MDDLVGVQHFFLGEKRLTRVPEEHDVYLLSLETGWKPDEIREMALDDVYWCIIYRKAQNAAAAELNRRKGLGMKT